MVNSSDKNYMCMLDLLEKKCDTKQNSDQSTHFSTCQKIKESPLVIDFPITDEYERTLATVYSKQCVNCDEIKNKINAIETEYNRKISNLKAISNANTKEKMKQNLNALYENKLKIMQSVKQTICK